MWNKDDTNTGNYFNRVFYSLGALVAAALLTAVKQKITAKLTAALKKGLYQLMGYKQDHNAEIVLEDNPTVELIEERQGEANQLQEEMEALLEQSHAAASARYQLVDPGVPQASAYSISSSGEEDKPLSEYSEEDLDLSKLKKLTLRRLGVRQGSSENPQLRATTNSYVPEEGTRWSQEPQAKPHPLTAAFDNFKRVARDLPETQKKIGKSNKSGCCVIT